MGCGAGRQAVELAKRRYEVMGVDLSVAMLTRAAEAAQERGVSVAFTQCDMAAMEFTEGYDAAFCVGSSFGFFDDARNAEVARRTPIAGTWAASAARSTPTRAPRSSSWARVDHAEDPTSAGPAAPRRHPPE